MSRVLKVPWIEIPRSGIHQTRDHALINFPPAFGGALLDNTAGFSISIGGASAAE